MTRARHEREIAASDNLVSQWQVAHNQISTALMAERARYDALLAEVLRRGLRDEKEPTAQPEPERSLPDAIQQALGQWPEGSPPFVANRQYAYAQLAIRPDDAEGIAAEIKQGEDIEEFV